MTVAFLYYGLSLNVATLSGNVYENLFISNIIEIPAAVVAIVMFTRFVLSHVVISQLALAEK